MAILVFKIPWKHQVIITWRHQPSKKFLVYDLREQISGSGRKTTMEKSNHLAHSF